MTRFGGQPKWWDSQARPTLRLKLFYRLPFQIDHILAKQLGGLTVPKRRPARWQRRD
ncbi:MAG TPA: hypothetical protein VJ783_25840 [Pirellulales bacterium]|nr:hypothetical protein [Pirellulales bacterium]